MKNSDHKLLSSLLITISLCMFSCEKDDPVPEVDQEVITDIILTFTEIDGADQPVTGSAFQVMASDAEGIGLGSSPEIEDITSLETGKRYQLDISLYNSIINEDITVEVAEDDAEHQFYYLGSAFVGEGAFLTYGYNDEDADGNPVGLQGVVTVDESPTVNSGNFRIVLRHDLDKDYPGADHPNYRNFEQAGGESDLDVTFQVTL